jgi:hypothetical protein
MNFILAGKQLSFPTNDQRNVRRHDFVTGSELANIDRQSI